MPTYNSDIALAEHDGSFASDNTGRSDIAIGALGAPPVRNRSYLYWAGLPFKRHDVISSARVQIYLSSAPTSSSQPGPIGRMQLASAINPSLPTSWTQITSIAVNSALTDVLIPINAPLDWYEWDVTALIQQQVNKAGWTEGSPLLFTLIAANEADNARRCIFRSFEYGGAFRPKLIVTYDSPQPVTGGGAFSVVAGFIGAAETPQGVSASSTASATTGFVGGAEIGSPPPRVALGTFEAEAGCEAFGGPGDARRNTLFGVEWLPRETHAFVTSAGETLPFLAAFDEVWGGVRDGVIGLSDEAWTPEAALRTRVPSDIKFTARVVDRANARLDADRLARLLPELRELWLPHGQIIDIHGAQLIARPEDDTLELTVAPKRAHARHPLLSGTIGAAFETEDATPETPIYAVDPAGGLDAEVLMTSAPYGTLAVGVRLQEPGVRSLIALGTPLHPDGTANEDSYVLGCAGNYLVARAGSAWLRVRKGPVADTGDVAALALVWTPHSARLAVVTAAGHTTYRLDGQTGHPTLGERRLSAGTRSDGLGLDGFLAIGTPSTIPAFVPRALTPGAAESGLRALYRELTRPGMTWTVKPPNVAVDIERDDTKALELAPGETLTLDYRVTRTGNYTGPLVAEVVVQEGLTASITALGNDRYRVTVSAPAGATEMAYTLRVAVRAQGADNPGSLLADVRDAWDGLVEVAASPVIAPNATLEWRASDPTEYRHAEFLRDFSAYNNALSWAGYARPGRQGHSVLATGVTGSAVFSGELLNTQQPQRMTGDATVCLILHEVARTPVGGVVWQHAAANGADGVHILRAQGGFTLRTLHGATTLTSPDVLAWTSGYARLALRITATEVVLTNRATMRSIRLARPAWADAGVRLTLGAVRSSGGSISTPARVHLMAATVHPYALSDIQLRRNMDRLADWAPALDGLPEYPDNAAIIMQWRPGERYKNRAAPALGHGMTAVGNVSELTPRGVQTTPGGSTPGHVGSGWAFPVGQTLTVITRVRDFGDPNANTYDCNFGVSSSGLAATGVEVSKQSNNRPVLRHQNGGDAGANAQWSNRNMTRTNAQTFMSFALELSNSGRNSRLESLDTGEVVTASGTQMSGMYQVAVGGLPRASGIVVENQLARNIELVVCVGSVSAEALADTKRLMEL